MVAGSLTVENESELEAKRLWNAIVKDGHNLLPKLASETVSGVTIVQGNGDVGTIKQFHSPPASKEFIHTKERVDELDEENFCYKSTQLEGGLLGKKLASAKFEVKFTPKAAGGCVFTRTCEYETLSGVPEDEAKTQEMKDNSIAMFKKIEAYLLSNPGLYC
uniref:TSA: Wollemia nobilis Ref_Wollemi_Transcript_11990_865 transcribed RNA sequence n=1 Tax=Wollemia nobilis TaxID=56998 RepID=A0A0C9S638_9CONI